MKKTILLTGATSGIGKETAFELAKTNCQLILVCRNLAKGKEVVTAIQAATGNQDIHLLIADLSSQADIKKLSQTIHARFNSLHVLINNAGVVTLERESSIDGIELTLATNFLGPVLLTHLLLDLLQKSAPARIVNVSSDAHQWSEINFDDLDYKKRPFKLMRAYAQSKLLLTIYSFELAKRLEGTGVTVNCVHPGAVNTHLGSDSAKSAIVRLLEKAVKFFMLSAKQGAATSVYVATSPAVETITGKYFVKLKPVSASKDCYDPGLSARIWRVCHAMLGLDVSRSQSE